MSKKANLSDYFITWENNANSIRHFLKNTYLHLAWGRGVTIHRLFTKLKYSRVCISIYNEVDTSGATLIAPTITVHNMSQGVTYHK